MGGLVKAGDRRLARHLGPRARKRLAAVAGGRVLGWYRRRRSDVVLVSFPKCGRTWLRVMIGRSFQRHFGLPDDADLVELDRLAELDPRVPSVLVTHDDDPQWKAPAEVERDKGSYRHGRVILLVRDPRDVIVSLYHQMGGRRGAEVGTLGEFVDEPAGGFASLLALLRRLGRCAGRAGRGARRPVRGPPRGSSRRAAPGAGVRSASRDVPTR